MANFDYPRYHCVTSRLLATQLQNFVFFVVNLINPQLLFQSSRVRIAYHFQYHFNSNKDTRCVPYLVAWFHDISIPYLGFFFVSSWCYCLKLMRTICLTNPQFFFQIMDILLTHRESAVIHNVLLKRDIGFNAVYDEFTECGIHAGNGALAVIAVGN